MNLLDRRMALGSFSALGVTGLLASAAFACTTYQGTWKVCGDVAPTVCVTSTGTGVHTFTTSGTTSAHASGGSATVQATGLVATTSYDVLYLTPASRGNGDDCMLSADHMKSGGTNFSFTTSGTGAYGPSGSLTFGGTTPGTGLGTVCAAQQVNQNTGNEAPVTFV